MALIRSLTLRLNLFKMASLNIKKGDTVLMLSGKDRAKRGKISRVLPTSGRVVVEGLNVVQKRVRARKQGQSGEIVSIPRAIAASKVKLICPKCGVAARVGHAIEGEKKLRQCKKCKGTFA